jgi:hypothetical protein
MRLPKVFSSLKNRSTTNLFINALVALVSAAVAAVLSAGAAFAVNPPVITPGTGVYNAKQTQVTITGDAGATFTIP